jgi:hypothetical protein
MKPGILSRLTDLVGLKCLRRLKISESEIPDKDRNSEGDEREGKPQQKDCYILTEND